MIRVPALTRGLDVQDFAVRQAENVYRLSFSASSAYPVERYFGTEVLDHSGVRLDRARRGAMPLLFNHDMSQPLGMVDAAAVVGERILIEAHLFDTELSTNARRMIEGGLRNVSIGYRVNSVEERKDGVSVIRDWEPLEVSIVTVPQDPTVGIGRSVPTFEARMIRAGKAHMENEDPVATAGANAEEQSTATNSSTTTASTRVEAGRQALDANFAAEAETRRQNAIRALAQTQGIGEDTVHTWITRGCSLETVANDILKVFEVRGRQSPSSVSAVGLSEGEARRYSLCRAILAAHSNDWRNAGFELECHETIAKRTDKPQTRGVFYVPLEVQRRAVTMNMTDLAQVAHRHQIGHMVRDLSTATGAGGGFLVQTSVQGFDELLRNISFAFRMGATRLTGLRDNITIPRQSASATAEWLTGEDDGPAESQQAFAQLAMSPKTVAAYTELSRRLLLQATIDVENLVNADLAAVAALAVDVAVLSGSGAGGQPTGLDNVSGVGAVAGAAIALPGIIETQTDLAAGNVMPMRGGYVTTPSTAGLLITRVKYANTASPIWDGNVWTGSVMGFPAMSTNQVAAGKMYFGDWSKCVVGEWGTLEVDTNPYAQFAAGIIGVRAMYSVDIGIRYPVAFTIVSGIT